MYQTLHQNYEGDDAHFRTWLSFSIFLDHWVYHLWERWVRHRTAMSDFSGCCTGYLQVTANSGEIVNMALSPGCIEAIASVKPGITASAAWQVSYINISFLYWLTR